MSIQLANYKGKSLVSDAIKLLTYSEYSHSAALFETDVEVEVYGKMHFIGAGSVVEAWKGGVRLASSLSENHAPGTPVDIFGLKHPLSKVQVEKIARTLIQHIGQKYSYGNVIRFVPIVRLVMPKPLPFSYTRTHCFCSELVLEAFSDGGVPLLERCKPWEVPPRDLPRSPLLFLARTVYTT